MITPEFSSSTIAFKISLSTEIWVVKSRLAVAFFRGFCIIASIEIELSPSDYKAIDEGIDKNAITLEHAPRHANTNIKVDNNNTQQEVNNNLTIEFKWYFK